MYLLETICNADTLCFRTTSLSLGMDLLINLLHLDKYKLSVLNNFFNFRDHSHTSIILRFTIIYNEIDFKRCRY
jgi:hypothetical protein